MLKRLWLGLILAFVLGIAVEFNRGNPPKTEVPTNIEDESGRRLLFLLIDSLSIPNYESMPVLKNLAKDGFYAEVEPCLERITYVCIKEALTGRTGFTLFGLFQNFGVGVTDPGTNLFRDAQAAGKTVAMVSAGDLVSFRGDLNSNDLFKTGPSAEEEEVAKTRAAEADILFYHWIWHDTQAHHHRVGTEEYNQSVARADALLEDILKWLPDDMDIIVAGDHGHADDGRHVQGLDIPTVLVAKSPNIKPIHVEGRIPMSAFRYIAGASTGLYSDQIDWDPGWESWLSETVGEAARTMIRSGSARAPPGLPLAAIIVCVLLCVIASGVGLRWWAPAIALLGVFMGVTFEAWIGTFHFPGRYPRIHNVLWLVPLAGGILGLLVTRSIRGVFAYVTAITGLLMLILYPVVHHYGVLKNIHNLMAPMLISAALAAVIQPGWPRRVAVAATAIGSVWYSYDMSGFRIFNLEIVYYWGAFWIKKFPWLTMPALAMLAAIIHLVIEHEKGWKRIVWASIAALGASGLIRLPVYGYVIPTVLIFGSFFWRHPAHARLLSVAFAWAGPFMFAGFRLYGVYATVTIVIAGLWLARVANQGAVTKWACGVLIMLGAYTGLAWTYGLTTTGIDFTFAIRWLPGRLHEQFWWVIAIVTTYKCFAHVPLMVIVIKRLFGDQAKEVAYAAAGLSLLRYTFVAIFAIAWLIAADDQAGGMRLSAMLQDAFYWLVPGLILAGTIRLGPKPKTQEAIP